MIKPGGALVYNWSLTDVIASVAFQCVQGAPAAQADVAGDLFARGIIAFGAPLTAFRKGLVWLNLTGAIVQPGTLAVAQAAPSLNAAGFLTGLSVTVLYSGPVMAPGESLDGQLFIEIPNFENVGL